MSALRPDAHLKLSTSPPGATVSVEGRIIGKAPVTTDAKGTATAISTMAALAKPATPTSTTAKTATVTTPTPTKSK